MRTILRNASSVPTRQLLATGLGLLFLGGALWWQKQSPSDPPAESAGAQPPAPRPLPESAEALAEEPLVSADDLFLERVRTSIEEGMGSSDFSVDTLARQVGMTRVHLYRRLRDLLAQTPSELIRTRRLERAERLLRARTGSVSQIAYRVGFKSASHFSQSFRNRYKLAPSDKLTPGLGTALMDEVTAGLMPPPLIEKGDGLMPPPVSGLITSTTQNSATNTTQVSF